MPGLVTMATEWPLSTGPASSLMAIAVFTIGPGRSLSVIGPYVGCIVTLSPTAMSPRAWSTIPSLASLNNTLCRITLPVLEMVMS